MFWSVILNSTHILHKDDYPIYIIVTNNTSKVSTRCSIPMLLDGPAGPEVGDWDPARYASSCGTLRYGLNRECRSAVGSGWLFQNNALCCTAKTPCLCHFICYQGLGGLRI